RPCHTGDPRSEAGQGTGTLLHEPRQPLVCVGHRARPSEIACLELDDLKSRVRNELVNLAIEVAAASNTLPDWREPVLPNDYSRIGGSTMFDKNQSPARL